MESAVLAEHESVTAELEARAKASIWEARAQTDEKTLAIESLQTELGFAQASIAELTESRQASLERIEALLREIEEATTKRDESDKVCDDGL
jgi:molybdenum-dependent DNA-binding transcriptional regulator ModE